MAYKALYRQFRPRRFADLKGQDMIARVLKNQIVAGAPAHAYLFAGPRGTGKTSTAKILASALNCLHPQDGEPCLECENCKAALSDSMMDIIEMDAASNNGVDNARDIRDKAGLLPAKGKYKIYIIDEVHMLTGPAFNALLKTLEEPPAHVVFILATTELDALPKTVLSRCLRFDFKFIDKQRVVERLQEVLCSTGAEAEEEALQEIADASEGAMRDALTILEKCCAFGVKVDKELVAAVLGRAGSASMHAWLQAVTAADERQALLILRQILDSGVECGAAVAQILHCYEGLLLAKIEAEKSEWSAYAEFFDKQGILRAIDVFTEAQAKMRIAPKPEIILEAAVLRAMLPLSAPEETGLWREQAVRLENQLSALRAAGTVVISQVPVQVAAPAELPEQPETVPAEVPAPVPEEATEPAEEEQDILMWQTLKGCFADDPAAQPRLNQVTLISEDAHTIHLQANNATIHMLWGSESFRQEVAEKMEQQFGKRKNVKVTLAAVSSGLPSRSIIDIID